VERDVPTPISASPSSADRASRIAARRNAKRGAEHAGGGDDWLNRWPEFTAGASDVDPEAAWGDWRKAVITMDSATEAEMAGRGPAGPTLLSSAVHAERPRAVPPAAPAPRAAAAAASAFDPRLRAIKSEGARRSARTRAVACGRSRILLDRIRLRRPRTFDRIYASAA